MSSLGCSEKIVKVHLAFRAPPGFVNERGVNGVGEIFGADKGFGLVVERDEGAHFGRWKRRVRSNGFSGIGLGRLGCRCDCVRGSRGRRG